MSNIILKIDRVTKVYDSKTKIGEVTFTAERGECIALCGGNGAGKSTIIKMITNHISPTSGDIWIKDEKVNCNNHSFKRHFSYVPEDVSMPKNLTAREVLGFFAELRGVPDKKAKEVCDRVGLLKYANKKVGEYSMGMKQRLVIAQSLLANTPLVIFDEPSNGLDAYWSIQLKGIIKELVREGITILLTSHILSDVEELASKIVVMNDGKILEFDTVENLYKKYNYPKSFEELFLTFIQLQE